MQNLRAGGARSRAMTLKLSFFLLEIEDEHIRKIDT